MKRDEKERARTELILNASIVEFGISGYKKSVLNNICERHNISKGMLYYTYKSKDDLYLAAVEKVLEDLYLFIKGEENENVESLLKRKKEFFKEHENHKMLYYDALYSEIKELEKELKAIRFAYYKNISSLFEDSERAEEKIAILKEGIISYIKEKGINKYDDDALLLKLNPFFTNPGK